MKNNTLECLQQLYKWLENYLESNGIDKDTIKYLDLDDFDEAINEVLNQAMMFEDKHLYNRR
jgi:hypothetical protein